MRGVDGLFLRLASDFVLSDIRWLRLSDGAQCLWLTLSAIALKERREFLPAGYEEPSELAFRRRRSEGEIGAALDELTAGANPIVQALPDGRLRVRGVREKHGETFKWADETAEVDVWNSVDGNEKLCASDFGAVKGVKKGKATSSPPSRGREPDTNPGSSGHEGGNNPRSSGHKGSNNATTTQHEGRTPGVPVPIGHRQGEGQGQRQGERQPPSAPPQRRSGADGGKQKPKKRASEPSGAGPAPPPLVPSGAAGPPGADPPIKTKNTGDGTSTDPLKVPKGATTLVDVGLAAYAKETARWTGDPEPASISVKVRSRLGELLKQSWDSAVEALGHVHDVTVGLRQKKIKKPWRTLEKRLGGAKARMKAAFPEGRTWAKMVLGGAKPRRSKAEPQTLGEAAGEALAGMGARQGGRMKDEG